MKVTLDLTRLLHEGKISQDEFDRFSLYAKTDTGTLAFNLLIGLGVVAVGGAALALIPTPWTGIVIGALLMGFGLVILVRLPGWTLLANICILVAALMFGGGLLILMEGSLPALLGVAALFMLCGVLARSGLLVGLSLLGVAAAVGSGTSYWHASYGLSVDQPALTILVFSGVALLAYVASLRLRPDLERLAVIAARTSVLFVNIGFWVGSLWGIICPGCCRGGRMPLPRTGRSGPSSRRPPSRSDGRSRWRRSGSGRPASTGAGSSIWSPCSGRSTSIRNGSKFSTQRRSPS